MNTKKFFIVAIAFAMVLSACGGLPPTNWQIYAAQTAAVESYKATQQAQQPAATNVPTCEGTIGGTTRFSVPAGQTINYPRPNGESDNVTCTVNGNVTTTTVVSLHADGRPYTGAEISALLTATAIATNQPAKSCLEDLPKSVNRPFTWLTNLDVGDARLTSILYTKNGSGDSLVALIDPIFNYDVEAPSMTGVYYQTGEWSIEKLSCAARELAKQNGVTNLVYIGLGETPDGFTRDYQVNGFKTSIWVYTETPIDTAPTRWETFTASLTETEHSYGSNDAYWYGQFWNGKDSKVVYHWIAEPNWQISTPKLQGTYWSVRDYSDVFEAVLQRFLQMTFEVLQRDGHPTVIRVFCGNGTAPTGYSKPSQPSDWTCERMP